MALNNPAFNPAHLAAAMAWPDQVGGLIPWAVHLDHADDETPYLTVESSHAAGAGFHLVPVTDGSVSITWNLGRNMAMAPDLVAAMNAILPIRGEPLPGLV